MALEQRVLLDTITDDGSTTRGLVLRSDGSLVYIDAAGTRDVVGVTGSAHVIDPAGGGTVDSQARTAIVAIIDALEAAGILAAS